MPEPSRTIPLAIARVGDLDRRVKVVAVCDGRSHTAAVAVTVILAKIHLDERVRALGKTFKCTKCGYRGATVNCRAALGHFG